MVSEDDVAIEERMQQVHNCLKGVSVEKTAESAKATRSTELPVELRRRASDAAAALLAQRLRINAQAADELTSLLGQISAGADWKLAAVAKEEATGPALRPFYRSGVDLEFAPDHRYDLWTFLVNARIGLVAPRGV